MAIKLTARAADEVKKIMQAQELDPKTFIRMVIVGGGCSLTSTNPACVPTVIEGSVKDGKLSVVIHDVRNDKVFAEYSFA